MQRTQADSFTQLSSCVQRMKKTASAESTIRAIPQTDFTFGRVESFADKALWFIPRPVVNTTFINESYAKTHSFLEEIFGKDHTFVGAAIMIYCDPFIENHQDLTLVQKKKLQKFCIKQMNYQLNSNFEYIKENLEPLLKETVPFFQKIQAENLIQFEEKERVFLDDFLDLEAEKQPWEHCRDFLVKILHESFGNIDIFMVIIQKVIKHLKPGLGEWTMI